MNKHLFALSVGVLLAVGANAQNTNSSQQNNGQGIVHWKLDGNTANDNHFIGTVNEKPLVFKANSLEGIRLTTDGSVRFERLKFNPSEELDQLPKIAIIQEDGTISTISTTEFAFKLYGLDPCYGKQVQNEDGTVFGPGTSNIPPPIWKSSTGNPAGLLYTGHECPTYVGIGTSSPQHHLDVRGRGYFSASVQIRSNSLVATDKAFFVTTPSNVDVFRVMSDGKVWATEVNVRAKENFPHPDYVFEKDYKLMSISELEKYITLNKHLPNIPSASEVENNGYDLGEMNRLLLEKVEELTLYVIDLENKMKRLEEKTSK
jgi:hypothetical protein